MESLGREAIEAMRDALMLMQELVAPISKRHGLTIQQLYTLSVLDSSPHQNSTWVADQIGVQRNNFAALRRQLEVMGLVCHERGKIDKRKVFLDLTVKGTETYNAVIDDIDKALMLGTRAFGDRDFLATAKRMADLCELASEVLT